MKIGLIDIDIIEKSPLKNLNVELMKTAKYYENNGWEVDILLPTDDIFCYNKIIVFANKRVLPPKKKIELMKHPNIEYYGLVFNNLYYQPIQSEELNKCQINTKYYKKLLNYLCDKEIYTQKEIEKMINTKWIRIFPFYNNSIDIGKLFNGEKYKIVDTNIFTNNNWEKIFLNLSLFNRNFSFAQDIVIRNSQDLKNFIKLINFGFINLKAEINIEKVDDYINFLKENNYLLKKYYNRIHYNLVFNENNNYSEKFLEQRVEDIFKLIKAFNELGIKVIKTNYYPHSVCNFAEILLIHLSLYTRTTENNQSNFHKFFIKRNRTSLETQTHYKHFLDTRQQYYYWFSRNFKLIEGEK